MKTYRVDYEWDCESVDEHDDVIDHNHGELDYVLIQAEQEPDPGQRFEVVLVRDVHEFVDGIWDGLKDRQWAYVEDGQLPATFSEGAAIPKKLRAAFEKAQRERR